MAAVELHTRRRWPSFAGLVRRFPSLLRPRRSVRPEMASADAVQRAATVRYYLGRGRRAREAGRFEAGCSEARRAIDANPGNPWSYALLGQCLLRQRRPDLVEARRALERACALEPANGYFVRLLLDVLDTQGDAAGRADILSWAWWSGASVERWLPSGPPSRRPGFSPRPADARAAASSTPELARPVRMPEEAFV